VSAGLLVGLVVGFVIGVGATLAWAACSPPVSSQPPTDQLLPAGDLGVLRRLDLGAELVGSLLRDVLRSRK
jgi:hypothetical protein